MTDLSPSSSISGLIIGSRRHVLNDWVGYCCGRIGGSPDATMLSQTKEKAGWSCQLSDIELHAGEWIVNQIGQIYLLILSI